MEKYYNIYVSGELKKYTLKEHGSSPKIATVTALWRLANLINKVGIIYRGEEFKTFKEFSPDITPPKNMTLEEIELKIRV